MRMVPGEVMMTAESRWRASTPCAMYMAMMPPETWAMPLVMMVISSVRVAPWEERADGERGLGLAHEDGGGDIHAFSAGDAHGLEHDPGQAADDDLHEADVVEHGEEGGDEDDGGQHLEGEDGAERGAMRRARAGRRELGAGVGGGEHGC